MFIQEGLCAGGGLFEGGGFFVETHMCYRKGGFICRGACARGAYRRRNTVFLQGKGISRTVDRSFLLYISLIISNKLSNLKTAIFVPSVREKGVQICSNKPHYVPMHSYCYWLDVMLLTAYCLFG